MSKQGKVNKTLILAKSNFHVEVNHPFIVACLISFTEVIEYARKIGIKVDSEPHLLYLAREGLLRELPAEWKPW